MAKILLEHGFNVKDGGASTIDPLKAPLEAFGHEVDAESGDYGYFNLFDVLFKKHRAIMQLASILPRYDVVIAHSNGANFTLKALQYVFLKRSIVCIFLSPAIPTRAKFPESVKRAWIFYSRTDRGVWLSGWLPKRWGWGRAGNKGYLGTDERVTGLDFTDIIADHSDWAKTPESSQFFADRINTLLEQSET